MGEPARLPGGWGWDEPTLRAAAHRVADLAVDHLIGVPDGPVFTPVPPHQADRWRRKQWPARGMPLERLLTVLGRDVLRYPFGNGHPRFHAWVNPPPDRAGVLADLLASAADPSCAGGNHAGVHLERMVIRWLAEMVGLPRGAGGLLVSGGSLATVTALAAARQAHAPFDARGDGLAGHHPLTVYAGSEVHSCVPKAVELLGLGRRNLRLLAGPGQWLDARVLDRELASAGRRSEHPVAVVASAGTASTGAIDPLDEIADVCARHRVWLHIDGAYGAPAILTDRYRVKLAGLGRANSVALDPHKWLYVPVDAGALLVRDPEPLRAAFSLVPAYLRAENDPTRTSDAPWLSEYGPEQTRPLRALRVWAALASTGRDGYRTLIDHDLDLAELLAARIRDSQALDLDAAGLSIVCFHYRADGCHDRVQAEIARRIQRGGESFLTTTELGGRTVLRACFLNPLTTQDHVRALVDLVTATGAAITAENTAVLGRRDGTAVRGTVPKAGRAPGQPPAPSGGQPAARFDYDGVILDLDGVVWRGGEPVPGAAAAVARLRARGTPVLFVTNDPQTSTAAHAARLAAMGIPAVSADVLTAAAATARFLSSSHPPGCSVFVVGSPALRDEIGRAGFRLVPPAGADRAQLVVVGGHDEFHYRELQAAVTAVSNGAALYATGRDAVFPAHDGLRPATGAILAAVEAATGVTATVIGKPEPFMFGIARAALAGCDRIAVVGDHLTSDIAGAKRAGLGAVLVLTGTTTADDLNHAPVQPDLVLPSLAELPAARQPRHPRHETRHS